MAEMSDHQRRETARFLKHLRQTGNALLSAERAEVKIRRMRMWRARYPDLATAWEAALVFAEAGITRAKAGKGQPPREGGYHIAGTRGRHVQVRRSKADALTPERLQRFCAALAVTANVQMSVASIGARPSSVYARRRADPEFERAFAEALAQGLDAVELMLLDSAFAAFEPDGSALADWPERTPPPFPNVTFENALMLLNARRGRAPAGGRPPRATAEETDAAIQKLLDGLKKKEARDAVRRGARVASVTAKSHEHCASDKDE